MKKQEGFTLVESLAVIAIIGLLLALGSYIFSQALRQARDTERKSDLGAIAQAFEARYLDQTCSNQRAVNKYPGTSIQADKDWVRVTNLLDSDGCGPFSKYLPTIPTDNRPDYGYYFSLSTKEEVNGVILPGTAKHYRLTASLERQYDTSSQEQKECIRLSQVWVNSFGGKVYDCEQKVINTPGAGTGDTPIIYNYYIGR